MQGPGARRRIVHRPFAPVTQDEHGAIIRFSTPTPILCLAIGRLPSLRLPALHPKKQKRCHGTAIPSLWPGGAPLSPGRSVSSACGPHLSSGAAAHTAPRAAATPPRPCPASARPHPLILPIWARTSRFFLARHATIRAMHDKTPQRNSRRNPSGARPERGRRSASAPSIERGGSPRRTTAPRPSQERASKAAPSSHRRTNVQRGLSELKLFNAFPSTGSGPIYVGSHTGPESQSPFQRIVPLAAAAAIVVILGVFVLPGFISSCSQAGSADPAAEEGAAVEPVVRTVS